MWIFQFVEQLAMRMWMSFNRIRKFELNEHSCSQFTPINNCTGNMMKVKLSRTHTNRIYQQTSLHLSPSNKSHNFHVAFNGIYYVCDSMCV